MNSFKRKVKKTSGTLTITLNTSETISNARDLHDDLTFAFSQAETKKIRLNAALTSTIDTSFLQIVTAATLHGSLKRKPLELKEMSPEMIKKFELSGLELPA